MVHVLSDVNGLPLLAGISVDNTHDGLALKPLIIGAKRNATSITVATSSPTRAFRRPSSIPSLSPVICAGQLQ